MTDRLKRKYNIKLFSIFKMFSWDLLFYYAIIYLFLIAEKDLSTPFIFVLEATYQISKIILQLPSIYISDLLGARRSIILAQVFIAFSLLGLILSNSTLTLILSYSIMAFGFNLKQLCETTLLYDFIPNNRKRNHFFLKIDGTALSWFYFVDAICMILSGFLFVINAYIPMILCFVFCCIAFFISFKFEELDNKKNSNKISSEFKKSVTLKKSLSTYFKDLKHISKFIIKSKRLKCLICFSAVFTALLITLVSLRSVILAEVNVPEEYFGIVFAIMQIIAGLSSKLTHFYQRKFKNRTLTFFAFTATIPFIILGLIMNTDFSEFAIMVCALIWLVVYSIIKSPFYGCMKQYLHNFFPNEVSTKIYAFQSIFDSLSTTIFSLILSLFLTICSTSLTIILLGSLLLIIFVILLEYMKLHVGLNPEEYQKSEITYIELK